MTWQPMTRHELVWPFCMMCYSENRNNICLPSPLKEFIHLISSEANEICEQESKKTISPDHIITALKVRSRPSDTFSFCYPVTSRRRHVLRAQPSSYARLTRRQRLNILLPLTSAVLILQKLMLTACFCPLHVVELHPIGLLIRIYALLPRASQFSEILSHERSLNRPLTTSNRIASSPIPPVSLRTPSVRTNTDLRELTESEIFNPIHANFIQTQSIRINY